MKKKKRLKKQVYYVLILIVFLVIGGIYANKRYKEYQYKKTYEFKLMDKGYTRDETEDILKIFKEDDYKFFLENEVNKKYIELTKEKYFLTKNFYKYIEYMKKNKKLDLSTVVRNINIHLDSRFYSTNYETDISKDTSIIVNKYYLLSKDYNPDDLVTISRDYAWGELGSQKVRKVTYDAFLEMWEEAKNNGYYLMVSSSYRTYEEQEIVYNNYKKKRGEKYADSIAARPGASEHQTGLTLDIFSKDNSNKNTFKDTEVFKWLKDNSYKFGFILRYPEDKVNVTGYGYESWHYRYVGKKIAKYIYENNITFEEYYAYFIEK